MSSGSNNKSASAVLEAPARHLTPPQRWLNSWKKLPRPSLRSSTCTQMVSSATATLPARRPRQRHSDVSLSRLLRSLKPATTATCSTRTRQTCWRSNSISLCIRSARSRSSAAAPERPPPTTWRCMTRWKPHSNSTPVRLAQACTIRDQAQQVHERAFGQEARRAAEPVVAEAERVVGAFTELASAWEQRASVFLDEHPDIQLLLAERKTQEEQARQAEVLAARDRRLRALVAECQEATRTGLLHDARRLVDSIQREFPDQTEAIDALRVRLEQRERAAKDDAARQALAVCAEHQARGDLEGAVNVLEQVDVHGYQSTSARTYSAAGRMRAVGWPRRPRPRCSASPQPRAAG